MAFFAGSPNIKIVGGQFNDIKGNLTVFDRSRHETNIDSNNTYNNTLTDSYNDNSKKLKGLKRPRSIHDDREHDGMDYSPSTSADHQAGFPPPHRPQLIPGQVSFGGSHVVNTDSFNTVNSHFNDAFNDYSQTQYHGRTPPSNRRRRIRPEGREGTTPDVEEGEDLQYNRGSLGTGRRSPRPFQDQLPQHMRTGVRSAMVDNPHFRHMGHNMRQTFSKMMKQTQQSRSEQNDRPNMPGNGDDNYGSDDPDSQSSEEQDPVNTRMADLSIHDAISSPRSRDESQLQVATRLSPPSPSSRVKSELQKSTAPRVNQSMVSPDLFNLSPYDHISSNPSLSPRMKDCATDDFLAKSTTGEIHGNKDPKTPGRGPMFRTIYGDLTKHDTSVHQTNISSFNTENNTIKNSFNDNSSVESSVKLRGTKK